MSFLDRLFGTGDKNTSSESEAQLHDDARCFAQLVVAEVKANNEGAVFEGRQNADIYKRLRQEIDLSRKVYERRGSPVVAAKFDYFYDEWVKTLAEGDASKLGPACEGPRLQS